MTAPGHSLPSRSPFGTPFVRCWSNSDRSATTFVCPLSATSGHQRSVRQNLEGNVYSNLPAVSRDVLLRDRARDGKKPTDIAGEFNGGARRQGSPIGAGLSGRHRIRRGNGGSQDGGDLTICRGEFMIPRRFRERRQVATVERNAIAEIADGGIARLRAKAEARKASGFGKTIDAHLLQRHARNKTVGDTLEMKIISDVARE